MLALVDRACQWNCFRCNGLRSEAALSSIETAYLRCENSKLKEATERQQSICDSLIKQERQRCSVLLRKQKKLQEELDALLEHSAKLTQLVIKLVGKKSAKHIVGDRGVPTASPAESLLGEIAQQQLRINNCLGYRGGEHEWSKQESEEENDSSQSQPLSSFARHSNWQSSVMSL